MDQVLLCRGKASAVPCEQLPLQALLSPRLNLQQTVVAKKISENEEVVAKGTEHML
jgi:hypothetical protein